MVAGHRGYLAIVHGVKGAGSVDAHTADAHFVRIDGASPLANMALHSAARQLLIEHGLSFH